MLSIVQSLEKQNLIAQRSNLIYQMLQNSRAQRAEFGALSAAHADASALAFTGGVDSLELENVNNEIQLMAINAELNAINEAQAQNKLDYKA